VIDTEMNLVLKSSLIDGMQGNPSRRLRAHASSREKPSLKM